jgi:hypothetical protein
VGQRDVASEPLLRDVAAGAILNPAGALLRQLAAQCETTIVEGVRQSIEVNALLRKEPEFPKQSQKEVHSVPTDVDSAAIRTQVEQSLPAFEQSTDDELLSAIGSIPFNRAYTAVQAPQEFPGYGTPNFGLSRIGRIFVDTNTRVRNVVCSSKAEFSGAISVDNVSNLLVIILPALGAAGIAAPPASAIALAVFILKIGLDQYCKDFQA